MFLYLLRRYNKPPPKVGQRGKVVPFFNQEDINFAHIIQKKGTIMSQPSQNYIDKITRWVQGGVELGRMHLRPDQRFRALLVMNAYRLIIENPTAQPRTIVKNLAARDYALIVANAEMGVAEDQELMQILGIRKNEQGLVSARKECEIANDIYCVNQLVGRLNVSQNHLDKLLYQANTRWLSKFGQQTGNVSAIREAQRNLEKINNDWKEDANPADALKPGAERNITSDISIIKPDRQNYSEDELRQFAKKIGAKFEDVQEFVESEDGTMVPSESDEEEEEMLEAQPTDEPDTYDPFNQE